MADDDRCPTCGVDKAGLHELHREMVEGDQEIGEFAEKTGRAIAWMFVGVISFTGAHVATRFGLHESEPGAVAGAALAGIACLVVGIGNALAVLVRELFRRGKR